ncbi:hypothetical protein AAG747_28505 [Rapidithrix thailandica]|uniref:Uncharacterized protein n=1 Tax=Rapidithrix thailandica TaxID=413964 RepID=A0AAW9S401_9BACT
MIRVNQNSPKAMEFTSFKKKENITDDELMAAVSAFESSFLHQQEGVIFHCLVRNFANEYANLLLAQDMESLKQLKKAVHENQAANNFFRLIEMDSIRMTFHQIEKENFQIPEHFSCVECGTFALKDLNDATQLTRISDSIEQEYLNNFDNTQAHFIGTIDENFFSEVTFGKTLWKTKEICNGYIGNPVCQPLLDMADPQSMALDFWYVLA